MTIAPPRAARLWDPETDELLVCRAVRSETHDVKTFIFSAPEPRLFRYQPGQFMTFELEIEGAPISRCYTLASSPTRPHCVSITNKRVPGGPVSNWMHDNLRPGMALRALGPMGEFTCAGNPATRLLFLAGGSGITPLMSMARSHDDLASETDIVFVQSARSPADIIFRDELALMAAHRPGFHAVAVCEAETPGERWDGLRGRLSLPMLRSIAPDFCEREVFTCGPAPYMAAVRAMLREAGFNMARYHQESFDFAELTAARPEVPAMVAEPASKPFTISFSKTGREVPCGPDTFVLDAARGAGMRLPCSCTKGLCGTCKSRLISGQVEMSHQGGIRQREIDAGMILLCCSRPTSDLVVER